MTMLKKVEIKIKTNEENTFEGPYHFAVNNCVVPLKEIESENKDELVFEPSIKSFIHSMSLLGPEDADQSWDLAQVDLTYFPMTENDFSVSLKGINLKGNQHLNLWHKKGPETFTIE